MQSTNEEVLAILLKHPLIFREVKRTLSPMMFGELEWLFKAMVELDEDDALEFKALLMANPEQAKYLHELRNSVTTTQVLPYLLNKLKEEYLAAEIYRVSQMTAHRIVVEGVNPNEVLDEMKSRVNELRNTEADEGSDPDKDVDDFFSWMEEIIEDPSKAYGLITGNEDIDRITTGFHRGDFIVVGARTSIGKSAFMIQMALNLAKNGYRVAIYSLEMSKRQMYLRMLANLMTIDLEILRTGRLLKSRIPEMLKHKEFLKQIFVDDTRGISAEYITDSMRNLKRNGGLDCVMVDYLQDVKEQGEQNDNGGSALARVCRKLRKGAQECDVAMFGLSQVTRAVEDRKDKRPMPSDLAGSTGIETSADVIIMLYRDDYYDAASDKKGLMEINFAKQRNAAVGKVELYYARKYQQLRPLSSGKY